MTMQVDYKKIDRIRLEIIYKALLYVVRKEGVEFEDKHEEMIDALLHSVPETDVSDIPFVLDELHELLLQFDDIKEHLSPEEDEDDK